MTCKLHQWESQNGIVVSGYCSDPECPQFNEEYSVLEKQRKQAFKDGGMDGLMEAISKAEKQ